ncbi:Lrp/AsnC family transcriptional regulator [Sphingomonas sp.]|uniref:Lrp/AsnC family transcriptional regulator n=1 Tax=Sphingomonas sp. TaxID=28214 RepID=UPI00286DDB31|nr:Lrp/AsnC family transcriptional regulator [Sphingomonas sp.]
MRRVHDLDAKDREILALLEADGRRSSSDIARLTSLSAPTVAERMARLKDIGVITGFTVKIDAAKVGLPVAAIIEFRPKLISEAEAVRLVSERGEVRDCYRVTGEALLVLIVRVASNEVLKAMLAELYRHGETRTSIILDAEFEGRPIFRGHEPPSVPQA